MQGAGRTEQGTLQHTQREATAGRVHGHGQQGGEIFARKHLSVHLIVDPQARSAPSFVSFALWSVFFCTALPIIVWVTARGLEHATLEGCIHNMSLVCSCSARPHISCEASLSNARVHVQRGQLPRTRGKGDNKQGTVLAYVGARWAREYCCRRGQQGQLLHGSDPDLRSC